MSESSEIIRQVSTLSYLGILGISFIANVVVPVPEEIVILAIGYVVGMGVLDFWITVPIVIVGALLSDIGMYALSYHGNRLVEKFYNKFFAKIAPPDSSFLRRHLNKVVFVARFLVQLRFLGPFFAGRFRMAFWKFVAIDLSALAVYILILMWAGHYFANRIDDIFAGIGIFKNLLLIFVAVIILWTLAQAAKSYFIKKQLGKR